MIARLLCTLIACAALAVTLLWGGGRGARVVVERSEVDPIAWATERPSLAGTALLRAGYEPRPEPPVVVAPEPDEREDDRRVEPRGETDEATVALPAITLDARRSLRRSPARFHRVFVAGPRPVHIDPGTPPPRA